MYVFDYLIVKCILKIVIMVKKKYVKVIISIEFISCMLVVDMFFFFYYFSLDLMYYIMLLDIKIDINNV